MGKRRWVFAPKKVRYLPSNDEKAVIIEACDKLLREVLVPRFLPVIRPTRSHYPVALEGKWHGGRYRFVERFRSDQPDALEPEFEQPFARLDAMAPDRFDLMWFRHTGQWWPLHRSVSLSEALRLIELDRRLHPVESTSRDIAGALG